MSSSINGAEFYQPLQPIDANRTLVLPLSPQKSSPSTGSDFESAGAVKVQKIAFKAPLSPLKKSDEDLNYEGLQLSPLKSSLPKSRLPPLPSLWDHEEEYFRRKFSRQDPEEPKREIAFALTSANKENRPEPEAVSVEKKVPTINPKMLFKKI